MIPGCPIFEPTLEEFESLTFSEFIKQAEKLIPSNIGMFKVRAPDGWKPREAPYSEYKTKIKMPIEQNVNGRQGFYQLEYSSKASRSLDEMEKKST